MVIGIDIGGMSIKYGLIENGKILFKNVIKFDKEISQEKMIERLSKAIVESIVKWNVDIAQIKGIGVGCPGAIDSVNGICDKAYNLGFEKLNICKIITEITSLPCKITNDANAAALAEAIYGSAKEYNNVIMLTLGTGVGGGIIIDKKLFEGNFGKGAELGHVVIKTDGEKCSCGRKGCLEAYASASALIKKTKKEMMKDKSTSMWSYVDNDINKVDGRTAFENAKLDDKCAKKVVRYYIKYLGEGLLNFMNIFRPDVIVLGGGLSSQKEYLNKQLYDYCAKRHFGFINCPQVGIVTANLGNDAGIIGAGCLML